VRVRHIPMSHSLVNMCAMTHSYMWHDPHQQGDCKEHSCVSQSHSYGCHDSFLYVPWLIPICDMTHNDCVCVWDIPMSHSLISMCDMTHSYRWHDTRNKSVCVWGTFLCLTVSLKCMPWLSPICVPWLIRVCDTTHTMIVCACETQSYVSQPHSYMCHDLFLYVPWLIPICAMTNSYMRHDPHNDCVCVWDTFLCLAVSLTCVPWPIPICDTTHKDNEGCGMR